MSQSHTVEKPEALPKGKDDSINVSRGLIPVSMCLKTVSTATVRFLIAGIGVNLYFLVDFL